MCILRFFTETVLYVSVLYTYRKFNKLAVCELHIYFRYMYPKSEINW